LRFFVRKPLVDELEALDHLMGGAHHIDDHKFHVEPEVPHVHALKDNGANS
jgi:hypothetical protein